LEFGVKGFECGVQGFGFRVSGEGLRIRSLGFGVEGLRLRLGVPGSMAEEPVREKGTPEVAEEGRKVVPVVAAGRSRGPPT
jgi:hypothetical protein